jgi:hypothetical protein
VTLADSELLVNNDAQIDGDVDARRQVTLGADLRSTGVGAETPRLFMDSAASGVSQRTLFAEMTGPDDDPRIRIYASADDQTSLEITNNARWDESLSQWVRDDAAGEMSCFVLQDRDLVFKGSSEAGPINDAFGAGGWNLSSLNFDTILGDLRIGMDTTYDAQIELSDGRILFSNNGGLSNPSRATDRINEAVSLNQCKSWGTIRGVAENTAIVIDGYNFDGISNNGGNVQVNIGASMGNTDYAVLIADSVTGSGGVSSRSSASFVTTYAYNPGEFFGYFLFFAVFART